MLIFAVTIFSSCSKNSNTTSPSIDEGSFQYKMNGNLVVINNGNISSGEYALFFKQLKGSILRNTVYTLNAQKGVNNIFAFSIQSDSLSTQNYTYDSTYANTSSIITTMTYNGQQSILYYKGDNLSINITGYLNGFISGNFTAKFTPLLNSNIDYSKRGTTLITEGQFKNVKCTY